MRKSIIAVIVAATAFTSVSAFATEAGNQSEVVKSVIGEVLNAKADHDNYGRAFEVVTRRLGLSEPEAAQFVNNVFNGNTVAQTEMTPATKPAPTQAQLETANRQRTRQQVLAGGDSEITAQKEAAQHAKDIANYGVKHNSAGNPGEYHSNGKDGKDGQSITGKKGATGSNGNDGVNGSNGVDGRNGKDADMSQVNDNTANIAANRGAIISHSSAINHNSAAIERNSQRIDKNSKDIAENRKAIKRVGAMAQATGNLHYNRNENGYAVSVGEYAGSTAIAGGVQFNTSKTTAVTVQASYDGDSVGASVGFHGNW